MLIEKFTFGLLMKGTIQLENVGKYVVIKQKYTACQVT